MPPVVEKKEAYSMPPVVQKQQQEWDMPQVEEQPLLMPPPAIIQQNEAHEFMPDQSLDISNVMDETLQLEAPSTNYSQPMGSNDHNNNSEAFF